MSFDEKFLKQLELLNISAKKSFLGARQGGHISLKRGHGIEFADYRKYEPGDDPRHIDWKLFGRSERAYIKRFREEQDLTVHIFIDSSASMLIPEEKWTRALEIAQALAYIALMQHDTVQLNIPGSRVVKSYSGASAYHRFVRDLAGAQTLVNQNFFTQAKWAIASAKFPGVAFFISDFLSELENFKSLFTQMLGKNLDISAIQVLSPDEVEPLKLGNFTAIDSETNQEVELNLDTNSIKEYKKILEQHINDLKKFLNSRQINFTSINSEKNIDTIVFKDLKSARML